MSSVAVCAGTVGDTTVVVESVTVHTATCTEAWTVVASPTDIDPVEFGGYFVGVFTLTLIFYFTVALPGGYIVRLVRKQFPKV